MNWFNDKKLLVPFDFSEESLGAITTALDIASTAADVYVVHVAPDMAVSSPEVVWETLSDDERKENLRELFHKQFADEKYRHLHFEVTIGDPGYGITAYAEEIAADVIVMPSHGRTGLKRLLIGSVAERVLRMAHCPVLVLRS